MPDLRQTGSRSKLRLGWGLAGAILIVVAGGPAQAENGESQASPNEAVPSAVNDPAAGGPKASNEPAAKTQKLLCMWRNKGVTGFCEVEPDTQVGASCACRSTIEHKARKFSGKVIVSR
jgi:hypothetical protein